MDPSTITCADCGLTYTADHESHQCPACAAAAAHDVREAAASPSSARAGPLAKRRHWPFVAGLVLLAAGWMALIRPHGPAPTVKELVAVLDSANRGPRCASTRCTAIDYFHLFQPESSGYHGTFSDLDGGPLVTWTFDIGRDRTTVDEQISAAHFAELISGFDRLSRFQVTDPHTVIDAQKFHVIALVTDAGTQQARSAVYLVPSSPGSADAVRWLDRFDVPRARPSQVAPPYYGRHVEDGK